MAVPDWEKLHSEQEKIDADISRIKEEQRQSNLSKIKEQARKRGDTKTVANIERIQAGQPYVEEGTKLELTEDGKTYAGVVEGSEVGKQKIIGFRNVTPEEQQQRQNSISERNREIAQRKARENLRPVGMSVEEFKVREGTATPEEKAIYIAEQIKVKKAVAPNEPINVQRISPYETKKELERRKNGSISNGADNRVGFGGDSIQLDSMERTKLNLSEANTYKSSENKINFTSRSSFVNTAFPKIGEEASRLEFEAQFRSKTPLERQARSFGAFGLGAVEMVLYPAVKPVEFVKGIISSILNPVETFKQVGEGLILEPGRTIGQITGGVVFGEVVLNPIVKTIASKKPTVNIILEESGTKRITSTSDMFVTDITQSNVKAILNKNKVINLKGVAVQDIFKIDDEMFGYKGQAEVFKLNRFQLNKASPTGSQVGTSEIRGLGKKVEGGFDSLVYTKSKVVNQKPLIYERTGIQTAELMSEPYQVFKEVSLTQNINKLPKLKSVSAGTTYEVGVLDTVEPKNFLRKNIFESKPIYDVKDNIIGFEKGNQISTEQYLATERASLSKAEFNKQFEYKRYNKFAQSVQEQNLLQKVEKFNPKEVSSSGQVLVQEVKLSSPSTSQVVVSNLNKNVLQNMAKQDIQRQINFAQVNSLALKTVMPKTYLMNNIGNKQETQAETKTERKPIADFQIKTYNTEKMGESVLSKPKMSFKYLSEQSPLNKMASRSVIKSKNIFRNEQNIESKQMVESKQVMGSKQILETKQVLQTKQIPQQQFRTSFINKPPIKPPVVIPSPSIFKKQPSQGFNVFVKKKGKEVKISDVPYTKRGALSLGARFALNTPSATFYIKPTEFKALKEGDNLFANVKNQFYMKSLKTGGVKYIEQNKFRINTAGELAGITRKGVEKRIWQGRQ